MKKSNPLIGLPVIQVKKMGSTEVNAYVNKIETCQAITRAGGSIIQIPLCNSKESLTQIFNLLDGLLLEGGEHVYPTLYGQQVDPKVKAKYYDQERDKVENYLLKLAFQRKMPILGICRGMQLINVHCGGTLHQYLGEKDDLHSQPLPKVPRNALVHEIALVKKTRLHTSINCEKIVVNSRHSQAVNKLGTGLIISATSAKDNVVEGIELKDKSHYMVGIQPHFEDLLADDYQKIFCSFVKECQHFKIGVSPTK